MKAIVVEQYGGPEVMSLRDIDVPRPGPGRILVRLMAAGVNPVDTYLRSGSQGYAPKLPWTPGMDGAGLVEEIGEGVIGIHTGMRVYVAGSVSGTYAEHCLCAPHQVFPLPEHLDWTEGACLGVPYFTAARALFTRGGASAGEAVLVHGASGGVGTACLQLAAGRGFRLFGSAGSRAGEGLVVSNGAEFVDHRNPEHFQSLRDATGSGLNLIIEMAAHVNLENDLKILAPRGRIVVVGSRGSVEISPRHLMGPETNVMGMTLMNATGEERTAYSEMIADGIRNGSVKPPIAAVFPLEESHQGHRFIMDKPHAGQVVIRISDG